MRLSARLAALVPMAMGGAVLVVAPASPAAVTQAMPSFLGSLPTQTRVASTVPANGDVNPYGVSVVRQSTLVGLPCVSPRASTAGLLSERRHRSMSASVQSRD